MSWFERLCDSYFKLQERNTTVVTEIRAGTASFLTLSYLLLVNPQIMVGAGVSHDDAVFATAISGAASCFIIGLFGNLPFGCAPGLGLSAYLTYGLVQTGKCTLTAALTSCWWSGVVVLFISLTGFSALLMRIVPHAIKVAIVVGMGLLIAMIGMVSVGLIVPNEKTLVQLGDVAGNSEVQLTLGGVILVASLLHHDIKGAILIGIALLTIVEWWWHGTWPQQWVEVPVFNISHAQENWDPMVVFDMDQASVLYPAIGSFVLIAIFDISGTFLVESSQVDNTGIAVRYTHFLFMA
jgi:adenine/guanine/hypoxanthine permease